MLRPNKDDCRRGTILLEAILALLLVVLTIGAVAGLFSASLAQLQRSERRSEALLLAENKLAELQSGIVDFTETTNGDFNERPPKYSWAIELEPTDVPELQRMRLDITYDDPIDGFTVSTYRYYSPSLNMSVEKMKQIAPDLMKRNATLGSSSSNPGFDTLLSQASEYGGEKYIDAMLRGGSPELIKMLTRLQSVVMQANQMGGPNRGGPGNGPGQMGVPETPGQEGQAGQEGRTGLMGRRDTPDMPNQDQTQTSTSDEPGGQGNQFSRPNPMDASNSSRSNNRTGLPGQGTPGMAVGNWQMGQRGTTAQTTGQTTGSTGQTSGTADTAGGAGSANSDWLDGLLSAAGKQNTYPPTWDYLDTESDVAPTTGTGQTAVAAGNQPGQRRRNASNSPGQDQTTAANTEGNRQQQTGTPGDTGVEGMSRDQAIQRMRDILIQMAGKKGQK